MNKPSVLYITLYLPMKDIHGGGNRMFEQIRCLSDKYDIHLISFIRGWEEPGIEPLKRFCREIDTVRIEEKKSKSYSLTEPGFIKNYYSREMDSLIRGKIKEKGFNIVQFEYLAMAQYRGGIETKARTILVEHQLGFLCLKKEIAAEENLLKKLILLFRYNRLLRYETETFKKFNGVIFISACESGYAGDTRHFVSPMGVDTGFFKPDWKGVEDIDLIYIGNFDNFQNQDSIVYFLKHIWLLIKKKRPETNIKIIGFNSKEALAFLKETDGIDVVGYALDIRQYLNRAKLFILPAKTGGGMRGKLLEALAMGKPVVSTSIGAEGYSGEILKAIKIADNPEEFADKTLELLRDKAMREDAGTIARKAAEKMHRWDYIFSELDIFYKDLLSHG